MSTILCEWYIIAYVEVHKAMQSYINLLNSRTPYPTFLSDLTCAYLI